MNFNFTKLDTELISILEFWANNAINDKTIIGEVSINNIPNSESEIGSMFLARILYGISAATKQLKTEVYLPLAETAFGILQTQYKNPKGGYYWAKNANGFNIHDTDNNNLAQAFVLYGLAEYCSWHKTPKVIEAVSAQYKFLLSTIRDNALGGFLDGFDQNWEPLKNQNKSLGTHLHLLEALVKVHELNITDELVFEIEVLINTIIGKFIEPETLNGLHRLTPDWKALPNEVWAGHNAELSWILCKSAKAIHKTELISECNNLAIKIMDKVIELAFDNQNGGVFNVLENSKPNEIIKIWWPQAETVIGLLNCYEISKDENYLKLAVEISYYISQKFVSPNGEWYTEITIQGNPLKNVPLVHFWKSLYHNIRYYVEIKNRFNGLIN